jgi:hypothetical protein
MISARNSFIVLSRAASMLNALFPDAAPLDTAARLMCATEGKLMGIFASKTRSASIVSVILEQTIQNPQIQQQTSQ